MIPVLAKYYDKGVFGDACNRYMRQAVDCRTKRQLFDLMLDVNSVEWLAVAIASGRLTADDVANDFAAFINGRYIRSEGGYTSALYVGLENVDVTTTLALCVGCFRVTVGPSMVCEVHSTRPMNIDCKGACRYAEYLSNGNVIHVEYGKV